MRPDFFEIVEYAIERRVGVKFSTNGAFLTDEAARRCAALDYLDIQISLDGATPETNDPIRGKGSYGLARRAMDRLAAAGFGPDVVNFQRPVDQPVHAGLEGNGVTWLPSAPDALKSVSFQHGEAQPTRGRRNVRFGQERAKFGG